MRIINDTDAVSLVVSSLLLIMVVAGGAVFLSAMMRDVGSQTDDSVGKSSTMNITAIKIDIVTSDLAKPAIESLVNTYNGKRSGTMLQLQQGETLGGTSNIVIGAVGTGTADIGATDRQPSPDEMGKYPDLTVNKFGTSGIVIIVNKAGPVPTYDKNALRKFYNRTDTTLTAYRMTGSTGTEKAFMQYLGITSIDYPGITAVTGNAGMLDAVKNNADSIGFIEYGYVDTPEELGQNVHIAGILNEDSGIAYTNMNASNFTLAIASGNTSNSYYPLELAHPLYFVTRGRPSSLEDDFIKWARSFEGQDIIEKNGYISYTREFG